jgi:hypothetical protein
LKVKDAIAQLQKYLDPEDDIILAWWAQDMFDEVHEDEWPAVAQHIEDRMDWSYAHDTMVQMANDWQND